MEAAVGMANGLVGSVLNLLSNDLVEAYVASSQLGPNSDKIKHDLMYMHGLLHVAQERGVSDNPGLKQLLQELTVKADQAEDALDELHYFIIQDQLDGTCYAVPDLGDDLRGHARHGRHALRHTVGNCLACFSCSPPTQDDDHVARNPCNATKTDSGDTDDTVDNLKFDRVAMSKKIKSVIEEIHSLCEHVSELLKITPHRRTTAPLNPRQRVTGSTITQDTLYGRRDIFDKTIGRILTTTATDQGETLSVLPVVGPGGIGKTTFTQHLYNDKRVAEHFAVRVWICVSTDFDVLKLSQQILGCIPGCNNSNQTSNLAEVQTSIAKMLKSKRFLIVFDDIWECNSEEWKTLLAPFMKGEAEGSMVLVTTRFPAKAEMVKTTGPIALEGLESDEFFTFFKEIIFGGNEPEYFQEDLDDLAIDIAKKLRGSPLAGKTVGRLLRKQISREHWKGVLENNKWHKQENDDGIMTSLRISYDYLPFYLKKCFSYFSLFPEDYKYKNLEMTSFWIAIGIIEKDEDYMEQLVENGFLMKDIDIWGEQCFVMHDLLHELSRNVSSQECLNICSSSFRVDTIPRTVRHLSVTMEGRYDGNFRGEMLKLRGKIDIGNLRALMLFKNHRETIHGLLKDISKEIESLRVLYIVAQSPESLPLHFSKLIHLRYLNFFGLFPCPKVIMPSALSRFYHLKFLELGGLFVTYELPKDISRLVNLRRLFVEDELHSNVREVGKMKCLQELKQFYVQKESVGFELRELGELTELGGELSVHNLERVASKEEAAEARLDCKRELKELRLVWGTDHQYSTESDVLDALQPHNNLGALSIINHGGTTCPFWLCGGITIKMLGSLHLEGVSWGTLPPFGQLLHLTSLTLINISVLHEIKPGLHGFTDNSFVHLKRIILDSLPEFFEWAQGSNARSFSRLEDIICKDCPNLCAVPFLECSFSCTNLSNFVVVDCPKLSLPPMPHTTTLQQFDVGVGSTKLSYHEGNMEIDGYSGELALHNLHKVEAMSITDVSHVSLTELNSLKSLRILDVSRCNITCHGLQDLTWLQSLKVADCGNFFGRPNEAAHTIINPLPASLEELEIVQESSMDSLALLSNLTCLTRLELVDCENLAVDGFNPLIIVNLESLVVYNRGDCRSRSISVDLFLELVVARTNLSLPAGSFRLKVLEVDSISAVLVAPICILLAATLRSLRFRYDQRAESFTGAEDGALQRLTSLNNIAFIDCPNLPSLPQGLQSLPSFRQLWFTRCPQIRSLPRGGFPTSRHFLLVRDCSPELRDQVEKLKATNPDLHVDVE